MAKVIIFSAPSGAGKSTIVNYLLQCNMGLEFSISATSRLPRGTEQHGIEYYFLQPDEFREKIENNEFIEYEEVYPGCFYGTLRSEIDRIATKGHSVVFDVDVLGGLNLKKQFGREALALFIAPPSIDTLRSRLRNRCTDTDEMIEKRVGKAEYEMSFAPQFDTVIVNDDLEDAKNQVKEVVARFLRAKPL